MEFSNKTSLRAIPKPELEAITTTELSSLKTKVLGLMDTFAQQVSPASTLDLEQDLFSNLLSFANGLVSKLFHLLEAAPDQQPTHVRYRDQNYRRLNDRTPRQIVTRFGKITLQRSRYRRGRKGKTIFPLETALGIQQGFTPAAASSIGQQFAETGSSQGRTIAFAKEHLGCSIGTPRLRKIGAHLADAMEPFRETCQVNQLLGWLTEARKNRAKSVVLSVSRDAVSLGIAPFGFFEMASVATVSVLADGKRIGTVYLARTPETNQQTLSQQLTSLIKATWKACPQKPEVVYVTDAGITEAAYWKNTLSRFYVEGVRVKVHRVVDYYHASERLTKIADCLKFGKAKLSREDWLERMRKMLTEQGGHGRVMRSVSKMKRRYGIKRNKKKDFDSAIGYLQNQKRFMNYFAMREKQFPIGSGVVESACKQIVSERMKLSGMRWKAAGAQAVMTLRSIKLSNIWREVFGMMLEAIEPVVDLSQNQTPVFAVPISA
jgi:hypothetical protein